MDYGEDVDNCPKSPSPRRAWIEIKFAKQDEAKRKLSPSPRRAWIEMRPGDADDADRHVALPTEGVD